MALSRRSGNRFQASIWPGFVDAMTALLLVLMFVLTIFMIVQFVLRETITGQADKLDALSAEVAALSQALGLERQKSADLTGRVGELTATLGDARARAEQQAALIASLRSERAAQDEVLAQAQGRIASFEEQVASLLAERETNLGTISELQETRETLMSEREQLNLALAGLRDEIDAQTEEARLAAARREALEALIADLRRRYAEGQETVAALTGQVDELETRLSDEEATRLVEAAAAEALRDKLENAEAELTSMTLALEEERRRAEETLTLLAAAEEAEKDLDIRLAAALLAQDEIEEKLAAALLQADEQGARADSLEERLSGAEAEAAGGAETIADLRARLARSEAALEQVRARLAEVLATNEAAQTEAQQAGDLRQQLAAALAARLAAENAAATQLREVEDVRDELARALAAKLAAESDLSTQMSKAEERALLLEEARRKLAEAEAARDAHAQEATEAQKQQALLNRQVAALRQQLGELQALLDDAKDRESAANVQIEALGQDLNVALARAAAEERRRRELEEERRKQVEAEKERLAAENENLEKYRSDFFGRLRDVLGTQERVRIVGDRFVFSSEVLFAPAKAELSAEGKEEIAKVADILRSVADDIPEGIDWVLQVQGHTDDVPIRNSVNFADNWELSQARALSVVRYLVDDLGFPPERLSAAGFGEYQPINPADTEEARAQNRRIELKITEK
ncbi:peptidoglycan -binding protein [Roseovarius amoyensis]|uniref:peptidoglycan -binding protein n=1 Tax=Roseovarius amoyensis TaxID=2211448 RepID=UPI000DBE40CC|nr:peptidoglycan -binding protein [Roseovarius amoyensis]